ncbi:hypothetical protein CS0771_65870 [Catellatospora sp. IY07-71]|uniref:hypothetical protein n=1 Tax=Catellatospora sp. IY07-71 TaxID=2728827 RepID=UPI001BB34734|nr:hypothetical protein [Catellatospora sp. IY07-71]BCJ77043.1 hypothetical protein CS0771_65870 [Catellatospora sp. IY07-71]
MRTPDEITTALRAQWTLLRAGRGRIIALTAAALAVLLLGLLPALTNFSSCSEGTVEVACPTDPIGPDGAPVSDEFFFAHVPLGERGVITARMTGLTGTITYPPPDHDQIVSGVVPWAKAGLIVKDGTGQGSDYAALLMTGAHGVRLQHSYRHDTAGRPGGVSAQQPRWLRLTRDGDTVIGEESVDGTAWTRVGTARLPGLPATVEVGLFATSPGDLTLREIGLGGHVGEVRFTQAVGTFDHVTVDGAPVTGWRRDVVGNLGNTDWEKYHRPAGLVEENGALSVTGSGDIGPIGSMGSARPESTLLGLVVALIVVIVAGARFGVGASGRLIAARAAALGGVVLAGGLAVAGLTLTAGMLLMQHQDVPVVPLGPLTGLRVAAGTAALLAGAAGLAVAFGALFRRAWIAATAGIALVVLPYLMGVVPLIPEEVTSWLLRLTPAGGFAMLQTVVAYPQVTMHYAPYAGYFPLPGWAGLVVVGGYAVLAVLLAVRLRRTAGADTAPVDFR